MIADSIKGADLPLSPRTDGSNDTVDPATLAVHRTFKDAQQAFTSYQNLKMQNVERNRKNALIQKKLNNEPPWSPKKLQSMGQDWRNNRPTGFLSSMLNRVKPPYRQVLTATKTLTFAKFPGDTPEAQQKTAVFREEITRCVRAWKELPTCDSQLTHENTAFGYAALAWDDPYEWRPEFLRQDEVFFPTECPQQVARVPLWARKRKYQVFELLPILENMEITSQRGWNIKNLVKAINDALPLDRQLNGFDDARRYEDWYREGSYGGSFEQSAKYVFLGEEWVREPNGKVSRYLFTDKDGEEICTQLDAYDSMADVLSLFHIEVGSDSLMSSRGVGRDLYNTHIAVDKASNLIADNCYLNGLLIMKKGPNAKPETSALKVLHPIAFVGEGYDIAEKIQVPANVEAFVTLDQHMKQMAEVQIGTFLPGQSVGQNGEKRTATEVTYVASIDSQIREEILNQWFGQYLIATARMQRGICHVEHLMIAEQVAMLLSATPGLSWAGAQVARAFEKANLELPESLVHVPIPKHLDEDAVMCCVAMLLRGLSVADVILMANMPANELSADTADQYAGAMDLITARYTGNPSVNQQELMRRDISAKVGVSIADQLIIPQEDNTIAIEATRQQIIELQSLMTGIEVPVSPRDLDEVHLKTILEKMAPVLKTLSENMLPEMVAPLQLVLAHFKAHLDSAKIKGSDFPEFEQAFQDISSLMNGEVAKIGSTPATAQPPANLVPAAASADSMGTDIAPVLQQSQFNAVALAANPPTPTSIARKG
tara:strand:- start:3003 stop:5315 length:2313 start_codon:yes stop_codon:yes gene_type:complete